jgi:4-hydroxybenzoate polyprenyltransferase
MDSMRDVVRKFIALAEVSRLPIAFGAVANVWLMVLLARVEATQAADVSAAPTAISSVIESLFSKSGASAALIASLPGWLALVASAAFAVGFLSFGAALNDILDAKHDRAFAPGRPIPSGLLSTRRALHFAAIALVVGILGAIPFGSIAIIGAAVLAVLVLAYDAFAKHVPAFGIVLAGLATAASMLALCADTSSLVPVWLAMSQTTGVGLAAYILADKRPLLSRRAVALGAIGWLFWSALLLWITTLRNDGAFVAAWFDRELLWAPVVAVIACAGFAVWKMRHVRGPHASEKLLRYGSLWKALVAAGWLVAAGLHTEAAWVGGVALALATLFAILREAGPQLATPVSWRS